MTGVTSPILPLPALSLVIYFSWLTKPGIVSSVLFWAKEQVSMHNEHLIFSSLLLRFRCEAVSHSYQTPAPVYIRVNLTTYLTRPQFICILSTGIIWCVKNTMISFAKACLRGIYSCHWNSNNTRQNVRFYSHKHFSHSHFFFHMVKLSCTSSIL